MSFETLTTRSFTKEDVRNYSIALKASGKQIPVALIRSSRARRYVLRLRPDGSARVAIPRGGSAAEALRFAERNADWLERQFERLATQPKPPVEWSVGTEILFRGELMRLEAEVNGEGGTIQFGSEAIRVTDPAGDLRPAVERHLWTLATREFPVRVMEFAAQNQLQVNRVTVRNQRSRWGSCSRRGTISLNWRLVQTPVFVQDYIILHELCHLRHMNHSGRFWCEVERVCREFRVAERWLKQHSSLLR